MAEVAETTKHVPLGWCLDGHHKQCPGSVKSGAGLLVCSCRRGTHKHSH